MRIVNSLIALVVGLAFVTGGGFIALDTAIPTYQSWQTMQAWSSTSATLTEVAQEPNNTLATYRYSVSEIEYSNDRVYVSSVKDNFGDYHQQLYQQLLALKNNDQPVRIWYNPGTPSDSIIDREMRWGLFSFMIVFSSLFSLIGLGIVYASFKTKDKRQRKAFISSLFELKKRREQHQTENNSKENVVKLVQQHNKNNSVKALEQTLEQTVDDYPWLKKKNGVIIIYGLGHNLPCMLCGDSHFFGMR